MHQGFLAKFNPVYIELFVAALEPVHHPAVAEVGFDNSAWRRAHPSHATFARGWQPDTQLLLAANLQELGALHGADPAPYNDLMRGQPDALFQWCPLPRNCNIEDLSGLVGVLFGFVPCNSGNAPLYRPG